MPTKAATKKKSPGNTKKPVQIHSREKKAKTSSLSSTPTTTTTPTTTSRNLSETSEDLKRFPKRLQTKEGSYAVETWPLHEVLPYERNARKIPESAIEKVAASLKEFGWRQPMVVDKDGVLIVGHTRRLAAVHLGWTEGPVHVARDMSPEQIRAYRLMDNRSHQESEWDLGMLAPELMELDELDFDLKLTGFNDAELAKFLNGDDGVSDPMEEWQGMPAFEQDNADAFRTIYVRFANQASVDEFSRLINQPLTKETKSIWHPKRKNEDLQQYVYVADES